MNVENTAKIVGINHQTFRQKMASYKRHPGSLVVLLLTILAAVITVGVLLSLIVYIVVMGVPNIRLSMFAWKYTTENCSMLPSILNTLMMTVLTLVIAVPIGVFSAIYLVEYSNRGSKFQMTLVKIIRMTTETLQGIPSIVFGLFGFLAFAVTCKFSYSLLGGAITMALMVLPLIMRTTEEALLSVPDSYREGSFGLGAGRLRTIFRIILPSAVPGILAGIILAVGRIVGETLPDAGGTYVSAAVRGQIHGCGIRHGCGAAGHGHSHQCPVRLCGKEADEKVSVGSAAESIKKPPLKGEGNQRSWWRGSFVESSAWCKGFTR